MLNDPSEQLIPIFGLAALEAQGKPLQTTLDKLLFLIKYAIVEDKAHWLTAEIGFSALAALIIVRSIKRRISRRYDWVKWVPEVLLAVIAFTGMFVSSRVNDPSIHSFVAFSSRLKWEAAGVAILGRVQLKDVPLFAFPLHSLNINLFKRTASTAMYVFIFLSTCIPLFIACRLISIVGFLDSIAAAKQNALRFGYSISPNRELVALG